VNSEFDASYTAYQTNRSALRRAVRHFYLRSAAAQLQGPTLDFGCGIGELLQRLPAGSRGLEYNQASVEYCRSRGLDVDWYDGYADDWQLSTLTPGCGLQSMVISHVLEHLDDPMPVLRALMRASSRIGIERILVIVPGRSGYYADPTHRTFVEVGMLREAGLAADTGFRVRTARYFPGNLRVFGDRFPHHELQVLFSRDHPAN
jgi:hypothetical protein